MAPENPQTLREIIGWVAKNFEEAEIAFRQSSINRINDIFTVGLIWTATDGPISEINQLNGEEVPINEESEYTVKLTFNQAPEGTTETDFLEDKEIHRLGRSKNVNERAFKTLEQICSEVTLTKEEFIDFVTGEDYERADIIEISSFSDELEHQANTFAALAMDGDLDGVRPNLDKDIHFNISTRMKEGHPIEEVFMPSTRFSHVDHLEIDGTKYPVTITTRPVEDRTGGSGQIIHIGDFAAKHTPEAPKIKIEDEIERIDWGEFLSSDRAWPDGPGLQHHL